jgi:hypothetical protein
MCEYIAQDLIDYPGQAICGSICTLCCSSVPVVGEYACGKVLDLTGGCAAISAAVQSAIGTSGNACTICGSLGAGCTSCGPSLSAKALPWKAGNSTANVGTWDAWNAYLKTNNLTKADMPLKMDKPTNDDAPWGKPLYPRV